MINKIIDEISDWFYYLTPVTLIITIFGLFFFLITLSPISTIYNYLPTTYIITVFILSFILMEIYSIFSTPWDWDNRYFELAAKKIVSFIIIFSNIILIAFGVKFIQNRVTPALMNQFLVGVAFLITIIIVFGVLVVINVHIRERLNKK